MPEPTDFDLDDALLPGLDEPARGASLLELAVRRSIAQLVDDGLAGERQAVLLQLMVDLAQVVDSGRRQGKASAAAMAAAQLLAAYQLLVPEAEEGGESDEFDQLAADLRAAAQGVARSMAE